MGAQKGKDLLLKLDFDENGSFETVAGMRSRRIAFNAEAIDITNSDSAGRWRELANSDAREYWGSGQGNLGGVETTPVPLHGRRQSVLLTLPPLGCVLLAPEAATPDGGGT